MACRSGDFGHLRSNVDSAMAYGAGQGICIVYDIEINMKYILIIAVSVLALSLAGCSDSEQKRAEKSSKLGAADAKEFIESAPSYSAMQMEGALIQVKANEYAYREAGHDLAADAYIEAFETYVRENSDSLSKIIFNE